MCFVFRRMSSGIIPARAGSTQSRSPLCGRAWDHPRSRGEHCLGGLGQRRIGGSSPLARGAPYGPHLIYLWGGIIPARAGSTTAH